MKDRDNYDYLRGLIVGLLCKEFEGKSRYPEGFDNISEIYDRLAELKEKKEPETLKAIEAIEFHLNRIYEAEATGRGWGAEEIRMIFELIPSALKEIRAEAIKLSLTASI